MSDQRLLSVDPLTGLMTFHNHDPLTDETTISYGVDPSATRVVIEQNKAMQNDPDFSANGIKNGFWFYAQIPVEVQLDWLINHGVDITNKDHGAKMSTLLNDPQYCHLKTTTKNHKFK
jgi:hypothetical protein